MAGVLIETGIYFLLLFTPFAFAGVELWAKGILQIVAGLTVAIWLLTRANDLEGRRVGRGRALALGVPIALFALVVSFQVIPLPRGWIERLAPSTHALYERAVPGYAEGAPFDVAALPAWLLADKQGEIPPSRRPAGEAAVPDVAAIVPESSLFPPIASARRTLSIYPTVTRERLVIFLCFAGLFGVVTGYFRTRERQTRLAVAAVMSGFLLSLVGILQRLTWNGRLLWLREGNYENVFGPFVNRNSYAAFAGTLVPVAAALALAALAGRARGRTDMLPRTLLWVFAAVTIAAGVFFSLSRGGILTTAAAVGALFLLLIYYGRRATELVALGMVVILCAGFLAWIGPEDVVERIGTLSAGQSVPSFTHRTEAWERVGPMIAENVAFGTGLGTFRFAFMRHAPPGDRWWSTAHNEYLELISDTGIAGGLIFAFGMAAYLSIIGRPWLFRRSRDRYLYAGLISGVFGLLLHATANSDMQVPATGLLLTILGALVLRLALNAEQAGGTAS